FRFSCHPVHLIKLFRLIYNSLQFARKVKKTRIQPLYKGRILVLIYFAYIPSK
ncbi:hypothetical protein BSG1_06764, partial [Bacillus sp. SG-1]